MLTGGTLTIGLQVVESTSLVSLLYREVFNHSYISFFHLLVNGFSVIYIYMFVDETVFESYFSDQPTFSRISRQLID